MLKNSVFPTLVDLDTPITTQPSSRKNAQANNVQQHSLNNKESLEQKGQSLKDENHHLPTPRRFLTPEDCPPGLDCLVDPEYIFMKQSFHVIDNNSGAGKQLHPEDYAKYEVLNIYGQRLFMVSEEAEASMNRIFCGGAAPFSLRAYSRTSETHFRKEVLQMGGHPGSFGCGAEIWVTYDQKRLGMVEQDGDCSTMRYTVVNPEGKEVLRIIGPSTGPCCTGGMGKIAIHEFDIYLSDGQTHVGRIAKHWSGVPSNRELLTRSDIWGVKFPAEYDVRLKALLLASVFLMVFGLPDDDDDDNEDALVDNKARVTTD